MPILQIDAPLARRVLDVVDQGLVSGLGKRIPGQMCVEAAVCFAMDLPHGDEPTCVSPALRRLKIGLNDSQWSSPQTRAQGMRRLAIAQLGSAGVLDDVEFTRRVAEMTIRVVVPSALEAAAQVHPQVEHQVALKAAAQVCREEGTAEAARAAARAAGWAARAARAAAEAAGWAAEAARAAAEAARAAGWAAARAAGDQALADFAEHVVQILISMNAPGCEFLYLTE